MHALPIAEDLFRRGFQPVPVRPKSKRPIHDDWQNRRYRLDELPGAFPNGENVGINLGAASDNTIDLDLDHPKATVAARSLGLPETMRYHRGGRMHLLVRCDPLPRTTKFVGFRSGRPVTFVEVRADGCQSIAPGSVHPEGDLYEWISEGNRADWLGDQAIQYARDVATVCLLADHWLAPHRGESGVRHHMALAAAGFLAKRARDDQQVIDIIEASAAVAGDQELYDRKRAAQDTIRKVRLGIAVVGLPTLSEMLGDDDTKTLVKWWPDPAVVLEPPSPSSSSSRGSVDPFADFFSGPDQPPEEWEWPVYDGADFLQMVFPRMDWLVGGFIKEQAIVFNFGAPGSLKTITASQLAVSVAAGLPFLEQFPTRQGRVLIVQEDTLESDFQGYMRSMVRGLGVEPESLRDWLFVAPPADLRLDEVERLRKLDAWMEVHKPQLVIFDAFYLFHGGEGMTAKDLNPILRALKMLRKRHACAIWILDHDRKSGPDGSGEGNPIDRMYGGRPKSAACDAIVESQPVKGDKAAAFLTVHKLRGARPPEPIRLRLDDGVLIADGGNIEAASGSAETVYQWLLKEGGSRTKRQMVSGTKLSTRSVEIALAELTVRGLTKEMPRTQREKCWQAVRQAAQKPAETNLEL